MNIRWLTIGCALLLICAVNAQDYDPGRLDKAIRVAAATDPDAASYAYLLKRVADQPEAQQFLLGINRPEDLELLIKQRRCGLLQLAVASLKSRGLITPKVIRRASIQAIVLQPDQQVVFGQASPAMCWLLQEDDYADAAEAPLDLADGFKHPLVAAALLQHMPTDTLKGMIDHKDFATLPAETRAVIIGMSMKDAPSSEPSPAFDQAREGLADGPPSAQRMYFLSAKDRKDPKLIARYAKALEKSAKDNHNEFWMLANIGFADLLHEVDLQNMDIPEAMKVNLLRMRAGQEVIIEP